MSAAERWAGWIRLAGILMLLIATALRQIAVKQARRHPPARAYLERKQSEGKSRREAIRCLKR